jgi:Fur family transcriptional regulator, zinc uptake regulator
MTTTPIACSQHNHAHCIADAVAAAQQICAARGTRLTAQRLKILELIWQNHKPLGAYALMDKLAQAATRPVAPPTVYRALEFLLAQGLIHRIHGLNAYVGCPSPSHQHQSHFLICRQCSVAVELAQPQLAVQIHAYARAEGFKVDSQSLEVTGLCPNCQTSEDPHEH